MAISKHPSHQEIEKEVGKKKSKTKLEDEKLAKKKGKAAEEYLDLVSQDNEEKGAEAVIEFQDKVEKEEKLKTDEALHLLSRSRKLFTDKDYVYRLAKEFYKMAVNIDWPKKYEWTIRIISERKLDLVFQSPSGKVFGKGIKLVFDPFFDLNALKTLVTQAENTVDRLEGKMAWQRGKTIYGPDGKAIS